MDTITVECKAKLNLAIDVLGKREDGYHTVEMVMQQVSLSDTVSIELLDSGIVLTGENGDMPQGMDNIAYRAACLFFQATRQSSGAKIHIVKRIPMGAGMAGGSADAAGVINGLNELFGHPLSLKQRMGLGLELGADVPFCIHGGCVLAEGIGEDLTPLGPAPDVSYLIAKPAQSVSTKWVYEHLDYTKKPEQLCVQAVAEGVRRGDLEMIIENAGNVLENATVPAYPVVGDLKRLMMRCGAMFSMMSGSGSAVFGMFDDAKAAEKAAQTVRQYTDEVFVA